MRFVASREFSVGMEVELQLVDCQSFDLVDGVVPVLELFPGNSHVRPEFIQNSVEVASEPCADVAALRADLSTRIDSLARACKCLDIRLVGSGTHPFCQRLATLTPSPRYDAMAAQSGRLSHTLITFATHVHLGVPDGDAAIRLMRDLKPYLPVLIVLSANSPFWHGYDTGFAAYRHRILASTRSYGQPPDFSDWAEFSKAMEQMMAAGVFASVDRIHWDLRPRPRFGTLEVRVMDAQSTLDDALALAAFLRALASFLEATRDDQSARPLQNLPWWMHKDNCFMASRYGLDAKLMASSDGNIVAVRDVIADLFEKLSTPATSLGEWEELESLRARVQTELGYERQRAVFEGTESFESVVERLADALETGA